MKQYISLFIQFILLLNLSGCAIPRILPLNEYPIQKTELVIADKEKTWSKLIEFFSENDYPIKLIDKASGLILIDRMSFKKSYTREVKGNPLDKNAFVIIPNIKLLDDYFTPKAPQILEGEWNVWVKEIDNNTCMVTVNLVNLRCSHSTKSTKYGNAYTTEYQIKSLGNLEKRVLDYLK